MLCLPQTYNRATRRASGRLMVKFRLHTRLHTPSRHLTAYTPWPGAVFMPESQWGKLYVWGPPGWRAGHTAFQWTDRNSLPEKTLCMCVGGGVFKEPCVCFGRWCFSICGFCRYVFFFFHPQIVVDSTPPKIRKRRTL